jgi:ATP:ADP antiporter, AAA family
MFLYLLCVLFAYYILKPVSRAMFLTRFDTDRLPWLYMLMAAFGGVFAYLYSKLAAKTSLRAAVFGTMSLSVLCLIGIWALIHLSFMVYVLNIFVSLFSIVLVSQGWLVAGNIFDSREAKRLYPLLGMGMVLGAAFGGEFTSRTAMLVGTRNLLLASAVMVVLAYIAYRIADTKAPATIKSARAGDEKETDFSFAGMFRDVARMRHLQVIVGIMVSMYIVDTFVEYVFQVSASSSYKGDQLTAFFGKFYGLYLNLTEFVFQLFITSSVVQRFGVGGTLQIAPATILVSSIATVGVPSLQTSSAVRLMEAATRYTLNRTGMELLYMPLPAELRNRVKAFIDICVDRVSRGIGGVLLLLLTATSLDLGIRGISAVVMVFCLPWMYFSWLARREYVATVRKRFEERRLDLEGARISVNDRATVKLLEDTAAGPNARQAAYAVGLLAETPRYDLGPLLLRLAAAPAREVREKVFEIAAAQHREEALEQAMREIRTAQGLAETPWLAPAAVPYALSVAPDRARLAAELLDDANPVLVRGTLEGLRQDRALAEELISREWLKRASESSDPLRRALAADAIAARGDQGIETLHKLLDDADVPVVAAACRAAGALRNRTYLYKLVVALGNSRLRGDAIAALAQYGHAISGTLSDLLADETLSLRVRRQVPRVLKKIPHQRSVDVLIASMGHQDLALRAGVLKALNHLRETAPDLQFPNAFVAERISAEARYYFELSAALQPFREIEKDRHSAARLLARTIEERLNNTLDRLFRLLGLRYPPKEIYAAYLAVSRRKHEQATAAIEFLDSTLERDFKRILLPLLDAPENVAERGLELFGVKPRSFEEAIRELIRSHDPWLVACAMAAAAELNLKNLAPEIAQAAEESEAEVSEVARSANAVLAA